MIELSGELIRTFRAVLRRSVLVVEPRGPTPPVRVEASRVGLTLYCTNRAAGVRHHAPGPRRPATVCLPVDAMAEFESAGAESVLLEPVSSVRVRAVWTERGEQQSREFDGIDPTSMTPWPALTGRRVPAGVDFLRALDEAARTAARSGERAVLTRVLLRGSDGGVAGTDGRHLYVETGHALPWKEARLVPALPVFGCREIGTPGKVTLARAGEHLRIDAGPWSFDLATEAGTNYPDIDGVICRAGRGQTRLEVHPDDASEVQRRVVLKARCKTRALITLDVVQQPPLVHVPGECGSEDEFRLARSRVVGKGVVLTTAREYLLRALKLGFPAINLSQEGPLLCKDERRVYLWMPHAVETGVACESRTAPDESESALREVSGVAGLLEDALERTRRVLARLEQQKGKTRSSNRPRRGR